MTPIDASRRWEAILAARNYAESLLDSEFWLSQLAGGMPADFDYGVVKSVADAKTLILVLPSCDFSECGERIADPCPDEYLLDHLIVD